MTHGRSDEELIRDTHNAARFFTEKRHIAWVLLAGVVHCGIHSGFEPSAAFAATGSVKETVRSMAWTLTG